jgi:thioredoxin-related protein
LFIACNSQSEKGTSSTVDTSNNIQTTIHSPEAQELRIQSFWDKFDFEDKGRATSADYGEQHFVDFINLFAHVPKEKQNLVIKDFLAKVSFDNEIQSYFEELSKKYLYDINSPFYNEEFYILFLENYIQSNSISSTYKERYKILLRLAKKNRVGDLATDFKYYADGKVNNLYDLKSKFIILFFYEPGCPYCESAMAILKKDEDFSKLLNINVVLLAIYPDGERKIWEQYAENIPNNWINGIDLEKTILKRSLYDLKASPTIYLLDQNKKILLKDTDLPKLLTYLRTLDTK